MCYFHFVLVIGGAKNTTFCHSCHCVLWTQAVSGAHILSLQHSSGCMTRTYIVQRYRAAVCSFFSTCHSLQASSHGLPHRNTHLLVNNDSANRRTNIWGGSPSTRASIWGVFVYILGGVITHPGIWHLKLKRLGVIHEQNRQRGWGGGDLFNSFGLPGALSVWL